MDARITSINGGITAASGFVAGGTKTGIKQSGGYDLALLYSTVKCSAAGSFTTNKIRASSVDWCDQLLPASDIQALICTSGCANACTGDRGVRDTRHVASLIAEHQGIDSKTVLVAATGVIGHFLPIEKIERTVPALTKKLSGKGGLLFAKAILTTDLVKKEAAVEVTYGEQRYVIGGCAKGSGMISPNMATMLTFISTDAAIQPARLNAIVKRVVNHTFNNLTVDGDTSTNDMALVLANGASGYTINNKIALADFETALYTVCNELCKQIAADGEGATKRVEIRVHGAKNNVEAQLAAKSVANSNLTKCALFGNDPNWGRIACAIGYANVSFSDTGMTINLCGIPVFKNLQPLPFNEKKAHTELKKKIVIIDIDLGVGKGSATAHTCDFSYDYVKINAEYHT